MRAVWARFRRDGAALFGLGLIAALVLVALLGPWLTADPNASDFTIHRTEAGAPPGPSPRHPLGVDAIHRDVLARLAHGARLSLAIATGATVLALAIGAAVGVAAALSRHSRASVLDDVLMRVVDVALALPYLLLVTAIGVAVDRADAVTVTLVLGATGWAGVARVTRARALGVLAEDYVLATRALGAKTGRLVVKHLWPGVVPTLLVIGSHAAGQMILAEAVLGYLTVGIEPPEATWGRMLHEAESLLPVAPWLLAAPGLAILLAVLGFTRVGDGLRDALDAREAATEKHPLRFAVDVAIVASVIAVVASADPERLAPPASASASESGAQPRAGGRLRAATTVAVHELDPALAYDEASRAIGDLVYATLVTWDREGELVGDLAERFTIEERGLRFRFELRAGLRFHDGSPLTAREVARSLERMMHPRTPSPGASLFHGIAGTDAFLEDPKAGLSGVRIIDERTVEIALSEPDASFLPRLGMAFAAPVCPSASMPADPKTAAPPCGAGPFRIASFEPGERVTLERFERHHRPAYLASIVWELGLSARSQRHRFERGELDIINDLVGVDALRYARDPRWAPHRAWEPKAITSFIFLNTRMEPFEDVHFRRAVQHAVDPSVLEEVRADVKATSRVLPPGLPGPDRDPPLRVHDRQAALAEMRRAGYPYDPETGTGGYPEPIEYLTIPDSFEQIAGEIFQQQLAEVGIRIELRLVAFATWLSLVSQPGEVQMGWRGWGADYPDPSSFFEPTLTTEAISAEGTQNLSFFSSAALDRTMAEAQRTTDWRERTQLFARAERIVAERAPVVPVYTARSLHVHQPWVHGYAPHPVVPMRLRRVWVDEKEP